MYRFSFIVFVALGLRSIAADPGDLNYVVEDSQRPRFRPIEPGLPEAIERNALIEAVDPHREQTWQFGWFIYGEANSRSVAVGLCNAAHPQLYVDVDRNKRFEPNERIQSKERDEWTMTLGAEFLTSMNEHTHIDRRIRIRLSPEDATLSRATLGSMSGTVQIGDQAVMVLRLDRNANGRWFDPEDRILLDTDGDGSVNPIGGRIACDAVCRFGQRRYVLQSDARGLWLEMVELKGTGSILPNLKLGSEAAVVKSIRGSLASNAGVRAEITRLDDSIECPVGDYRIDSLDLEVSLGDRTYWFRFSGLQADEHPIHIGIDSEVAFDLLGDIQLTHMRSKMTATSADVITLTPTLRTTSGLYLINAKRGDQQAHLENRLLATSRFETTVVSHASTGFS